MLFFTSKEVICFSNVARVTVKTGDFVYTLGDGLGSVCWRFENPFERRCIRGGKF